MSRDGQTVAEPLLHGATFIKEPSSNASHDKREEGMPRWKRAGIIVLIGAVAGIGLWKKALVTKELEALWSKLEGLGYNACPIVGVLCFVSTLVSGPTFVVEMSAGALFEQMFGMPKGAYVGMASCGIAIWLGCITAFELGRKFFKPTVQEFIAGNPMLKIITEIIAEEGWKFAFLMRLNPLLPFELFNYAVAMTDISRFHNAIAAVGTLPIAFFEIYTAASAASIADDETGSAAEGQGGKVKETLIKLAISGVLIGAVAFYGKYKYDQKVKTLPEERRQTVADRRSSSELRGALIMSVTKSL